MRFAISLLTLIAIASVIGTVMKQNEPMPNYVNQFGPFWFEIFAKLGLYAVYSAWWFLLIMGFLVLSTSLCIARNAPKMLRDVKSWRDNVREQSLRNFHHKHEWQSGEAPAEAAARLVRSRRATRPSWPTRTAHAAGGQAGRGQQVGLHLRARGHRHHLPGRLARFGPADPLPAMVLGKQAFAGNGIIPRFPRIAWA
jgi:cytochrome c biogenesis protein